jgi:hypothetical protein
MSELAASHLTACPSCPVGRDARREFWEQAPGYYSAIVLLPFAIVVLAGRLLGRRAS